MTIKAVVFDAYGTLYDIQSVAAVTEEAFPGYGEIITQVWRIKQLEYTWLRSLMRRYEDFSVVTRNSLVYTLRCLGLEYDAATFDAIMDKYLHLDLYPDALASLAALKDKQARHPLQWQPRYAQRAGDEQWTRPGARCHHQRRCQQKFQTEPGCLHLDRIDASRPAFGGAVHLFKPVGRLRRQGVRPQRRMDRAGDAGGDGAGLH